MKALRTALLAIMIAAACAGTAQAAPTASQIMHTAAQKLTKAKGISANYTVSAKGHGSASGSIKVQGKSFVIAHSGITTWFDGKTQWNYNASSSEVTVSTPTAEEIQSVNPYALLTSYSSLYNIASAKSRIPGTYAITLTPKSKSNPVVKATLYIKASDYQPTRLDITAQGGTVTTLIISGIRTGQSFPSSTFRFQKSAYPKATIVDLR